MRFPISVLLVLAPLAVFASPPPSTAPAAGPGGVIMALKAFTAALDAGDANAIGNLIAEASPGVDFALDGDGGGAEGKMREVASRPLQFFEIAANGARLVAVTKADVVGKLRPEIAGNDQRQVHTVVRRIQADCPSGNCSYGIVEFERTTVAGGRSVTVPMRATALLSYDAAAEHHFRIFHWHASTAGEPIGAR